MMEVRAARSRESRAAHALLCSVEHLTRSSGDMHLTERQKWVLLASAASALAAPLAEGVLTDAWRRVTGEEPPVDLAESDIEWRRVLAWTAASAVVVGLAQVVARRGAALLWHRVTGARPPRPRRRKRRA